MKKILKVILILLIVCGLLASAGLFTAYKVLNKAPLYSKDSSFMVEGGNTLRTVATRLEKEGLIKHRTFFIILAYIQKKKNMMQGSYMITKGESCLDILDKLSSGHIKTVSVTIPEGFNMYDIAARFGQAGICSEREFLFYAQDRDFLKSIGIHSKTAEGYLFPNTYSFGEKTPAKAVIKYLYNQMMKELESLDYASRMRKDMSLHQLLIVASLVEKEAQIKSEQKLVASVFLNRIDRHMRFDSDPTVRYAVKKFTGRIRYKDLDSDSPFNTYRHYGYTPTPIASPGRGAIDAVLSPADTDFLFFVARNDGSHYFSKTMSRHSKAVDYYQKNIKNGFIDDQR
jgi:UPF0755 protein